MKKSIIQDEDDKYDFSNVPRKRWKSSLDRKGTRTKKIKTHGPDESVTSSSSHVYCDISAESPCEDVDHELATLSTPVSKDKLYTIQLQQHSSCLFTDRKLNFVLIPDFNKISNSLMFQKYCVVQRKAVCFQGDWKSIYACTCDINSLKIYDAVEMHVLENVTDHENEECIHITVVKGMHTEDTADDFSDVDLDHGYSQRSDMKDKVVDISTIGNPAAAVFIDSIGVVGCHRGKLECFVCHSACEHINFIEILSKSEEDVPDVVDALTAGLCDSEGITTEHQFKCFSNAKIPFHKMSPMSTNFDWEFCAPHPTDRCECGERTEKLSTKVHLFTLLKIVEITVITRRCPLCGKKYDEYDGLEDDIINMGSFLIHHGVLRNYMHHFLYARCSIHSYYSVWRANQEAEGNDNFAKVMSYSKFRHTWYGFLKLLDCDYEDGFKCTICGEIPSTILMDATGLSHRKMYAPPVPILTIEGKVSPLKPMKLFITNKGTRTMLLQYINTGKDTSDTEFTEMKEKIESTAPSLTKVVQYLEDVGHTRQPPKDLAMLLSQLASHSHITGYVHKNGNAILKDLLQKKDKLTSINFLKDLNEAYPILFNVLQAEGKVPDYLVPVLECLVDMSESTEDIPIPTTVSSDISMQGDTRSFCFPHLPVVRNIVRYDKKTAIHGSECTVTENKKLLPGLFTILCPHGIYYGYQLMDKVESVGVPFNLLWTRFPEAPTTVIYDNACNLHSYCIRREPSFFSNTVFLEDRLHVRGHKCAV